MVPLTASRSGWRCSFSQDGISVITPEGHSGKYRLLKAPYCGKCSSPGVTTGECGWHWKNAIERTYAVGAYLSYERDDSRNDLLSNHIRELKHYVSYSLPLGWAMSLCVDNVYPELKHADVIVPVPKHPDELRIDYSTRAPYNQAEELANTLGKDIGMKVTTAVVKTRPHSQTGQSWANRVEESDGLYVLSSDFDTQGKTILMVDDVRTSGGTLSACARELLKNGARKVNAFVVGREARREWKPQAD